MTYEFELSCAMALGNYLKFFREALRRPPPLQVEASLHGVKGSLLRFGVRTVGKALDDEVVWCGTITDYNANPAEILRPFFEQVWDAFGIPCIPEAHPQLVKSLEPK